MRPRVLRAAETPVWGARSVLNRLTFDHPSPNSSPTILAVMTGPIVQDFTHHGFELAPPPVDYGLKIGPQVLDKHRNLPHFLKFSL